MIQHRTFSFNGITVPSTHSASNGFVPAPESLEMVPTPDDVTDTVCAGFDRIEKAPGNRSQIPQSCA